MPNVAPSDSGSDNSGISKALDPTPKPEPVNQNPLVKGLGKKHKKTDHSSDSTFDTVYGGHSSGQQHGNHHDNKGSGGSTGGGHTNDHQSGDGHASRSADRTPVHGSAHLTIDQFLVGLAQTEHGVYDWVDNGAGAYGAYQILASNWPSWARSAGVDPNDHSQTAQDKVARWRVEQYAKQYHGDWAMVAAAWFGGSGGAAQWAAGGNPGDGNIGTDEYVKRVLTNAGASPHAVHAAVSGHGGGAVSSGGSADSATVDGESGPSLDMKQLAKQYGSIAAVLNDTQLTHLVKNAIDKGWDDATFQAKLYQTKFYQKHSDAQKNWLLLQNGPDKGEAQTEVHKRAGQIVQLAASMGVNLSHGDVLDLAQKSLYNGFDDTQLQTAIGHHFEWAHGQHDAGQAGVFQDQYRQLASAYGVPVSGQTLQGWVQQSLTGKMTPDSVKAYMEQQALSMYPGLAQQLKQGLTVADVAGPYRDAMANLLELNPDAVKLTDPSVKKALQYMPDPAKPPTLMPMWQFEQQVRNDPRWLNTSNAKQSAMDVGVNILKDWGLTG